ncbi:MAG: hypothetical protein AW09_000740 [Candidatus Accumulibacter phosphatis]|uniref:Uncharacterized protein n=1 Tax=Candidatus Accumulibacter phosphatis TaxID=327160 RepID=A0A080LYP1_9PROT|nr:MAG: hypothetical protein AW09_000740 [Candidatus Accumulibacter phosphatis]
MTMTKASGQRCLMFSPTETITLVLTLIKSSRLMPGLRDARLARHAGRDDNHVGTVDGSVIAAAGQGAVEALDRPSLGEVERLALGDAVGDIEQRNVAQLLDAGEQGERTANLTGADKCNLLA